MHESLGVSVVRGREHDGAFGGADVRKAVVHVVRGEQTNPAVPMLAVVPGKEVDAVHALSLIYI